MAGIGQQFKGVSGGVPLDTNAIGAANKTNRQAAGEPTDEGLKISYGSIAVVDDETNRVRIDLFRPGNSPERLGKGVDNQHGIWVPLVQPLQVIHLLYGSLRKGLVVRVFWRGKNEPGADALAEVIYDGTMVGFNSGSQEARSNELNTGPHDIFTGGVNF